MPGGTETALHGDSSDQIEVILRLKKNNKLEFMTF